MAGETVSCGVRQFNGEDGVVIHIFLPQPAPPQFVFGVNVYQPYAKQYADPVYYTGS